MSKSPFMLALAVAFLAAGSSAVMAQQSAQQQPSKQSTAQHTSKQQTVTMKEQKPGLLKQAKVPADSAKKLATAKMPSEQVVREEIRQDSGGKLVYTFAFKDSAKSGVDVVHVDANTGTVSEAKHMNKSGEGSHSAQRFDEGKISD